MGATRPVTDETFEAEVVPSTRTVLVDYSEDPAELVRTATAIAARYMGSERAGDFGKRNGVPGELVVRLRPVKVLSAFDLTG